jgi:hypothetical protein
VTEIRELFDEAVSAPPPSRLTADSVYRVARTQRLRAVAAMVSLVVAVAGGITVAGALATGHGANPPAGTAPPGTVVWAGRGDATHLYVLTNACPESIPPTPGPTVPVHPATAQCARLLGSDDAGATWTFRSGLATDGLTVLGPRTLLYLDLSSLVTATPATGQTYQLQLSTDGGLTWRPLPADGPPVSALPPGGTVYGYGQPGEIKVYDPAQERLRPLTAGPDLYGGLDVIPVGDGRTLWLYGLDPQQLHPAMAVSHDGGAQWTDHLLPDSDSAVSVDITPPTPGGLVPQIALGAVSVLRDAGGRTGYVGYYDSHRTTVEPGIPGTEGWGVLRAFRTTDGGDTWAPISADATLPSYSQGWVTADGRIVLDLSDRKIGDLLGDEFIVSPDGLTWSVGRPPGLPADLTAAGATFAYTGHAVYTSTDGWTWTQVWHD